MAEFLVVECKVDNNLAINAYVRDETDVPDAPDGTFIVLLPPDAINIVGKVYDATQQVFVDPDPEQPAQDPIII